MDRTKTAYASFPLEWTVKSISYQIRYRKAFNINEIDEVFCSIINAKGNQIDISELGSLLGFNLKFQTSVFFVFSFLFSFEILHDAELILNRLPICPNLTWRLE